MLTCLVISVLRTNAQSTLIFEIDQPFEPLEISAGADLTYDGNSVVVLGGNPTATGALGNYTYAWSPEEYLDDATASNPTVINLVGPTTFTLTVFGEGALCEKTAQVFVDYTLGLTATFAHDLRVFPNPFTETVRFDSEIQFTNIFVHDLAGNGVLQANQFELQKGTLDAAALEAGLYFFTFVYANGNHTTLKLCKTE
jgi:hypothetical protein